MMWSIDDDDKAQLFESFSLIAFGSPNYKSEASNRGGKNRPPKNRKHQAGSSSNVPPADNDYAGEDDQEESATAE